MDRDRPGGVLGPAVGFSRKTKWALTVAATAVSTYALDAVATGAGVLLVASGVIHGVDHALLLVVLAGSYVLWAAGLRINLKANWMLLEETGTSTNVLSKTAYDLTKLATRRVGTRKLAAALGYVGTEVAKEVPYYAGAFGAALVSESVSSGEAIVFLAGANLGAAAYEYGLARLTRKTLSLRTPERAVTYASFETDWVPQAYLSEYYGAVEPDEVQTIAFFVDAMKRVEPDGPVLFFGVGPTLHHVFLAAGKASEIHLADYLPANLSEIERWLRRDARAHDWRPFVRYTLECEGLASPTDEHVRRRENVTRAKITSLLRCDAGRVDSLHAEGMSSYGTVVSAYCADSATGDRATWEMYMKHVAGLVRPGGTFITAALRRSSWYLVGGKAFPSANVDEDDIRAVLEPDFELADCSIEVRDVADHEAQGYSGIVLASARRRVQRADL